MKAHEKIRIFREAYQLSQEDMAGKLNMSIGGYAKIERGQTKLYIDKLQKIAQIFNINAQDLLDDNQNEIYICIGDNSNHINNKYINDVSYEVEKLNLMLQFKDEIIACQQSEIDILKKALDALQSRE